MRFANAVILAADRVGSLRLVDVDEEGTPAVVATFGVAFEVRTQVRVPLQRAQSTGNQGVALMPLAQRVWDALPGQGRAGQAVQQIKVALVTTRDGGGGEFDAVYYEEQLPKPSLRQTRGGRNAVARVPPMHYRDELHRRLQQGSFKKETACHSRAPSRQSSGTKHLPG